MMIRDFINTEEDVLDVAAEAAVGIRGGSNCNLNGVNGLPLGMMYAPMQEFRQLYTPEEALCRGTLFCELDLPFRGGARQ